MFWLWYCVCLPPVMQKPSWRLRWQVRSAIRCRLLFPEMIHDGFFVGQYASRIRDVVTADLESSGLFRIINDNSYIQEFSSMDQEPKFVDWTAINAHALVQSSVAEIPGNKLRVEFRLWDVPAENQLKGQSFTTTKDNWRRVAHVIADAIYERLTGDKGYFDTRVVYVSESGPVTRRSSVWRLWIRTVRITSF